MTDLINRLASLTGPDREVDAEIALANGWTRGHFKSGDVFWRGPDGEIQPCVRSYTASIDAALTLVPERLYWRFSQMHEGVIGSHAWVCGASSLIASDVKIWGECISAPEHHRGNIPAIALLIAIMRAKERDHENYVPATTKYEG